MILAVIVPSVVIIREAVVSGSAPEKRFEAPGGVEFQAGEAGSYYLWHHYDVEYEGQTFHDASGLPDGLTYSVKNQDGDELQFILDESMYFHGMSDAKQSIGYVELSAPQTLMIQVSGECPPTVLSVSIVHPFKVLASILLSFVAAAVCGLLGLSFASWGIIRMCTAKKLPPPVPA